MISAETNKLLTQVAAGTPMGDLLRRYWWPLTGTSEFDTRSTKPIRLMGEDLVLFKTGNGAYGLTQRHCPHRNADLSLGIVEECGLRCNYHGWMFAPDGACLERPYEDVAHPERRLREKVRAKAYQVRAHADILWAYLGPDPAPEIPDWEMFSWKNGFRQIVISEIPCNWFQAQENSIDPVHFEWMHENWGKRLKGEDGPYGPKHMKVGFEEFEHGFIYRRVMENTDEADPMWTVGRVCLWPNALFTSEHIEWRVPIDDENMLSVTWSFTRVPTDAEPYVQESVPVWEGPVRDAAGRWIDTHVMNQDFIAWAGQGAISNRTNEHLGPSDAGIVAIRKRYLEDMKAVAAGGDPKGLIRDPGRRQIELPVASREWNINGLSRAQMKGTRFERRITGDFALQAGQPEHVRKAFRDAVETDRGGAQ